ncbi:MAG: DUF2080 family transposase-associated protein [Deltaproteobacteria bacterium]|nr:DUF2080 family transposase-associated protein [Deltaproteobacteria bacterium]
MLEILTENKSDRDNVISGQDRKKVKLIIYGEEIIDKTVNTSGKGGRIYLPFGWVGRRIKVIRID